MALSEPERKARAAARTARYRAQFPGRVAASQAASNARHPHAASIRSRRWQVKNPEKVTINNRRYRLKKNFDITDAEYERRLAAQSGRCKLCTRTPEDNGRRLAVDHDHDTGHVRGLLCTGCNSALGALGDNAEGLRRALEYLTCQA